MVEIQLQETVVAAEELRPLVLIQVVNQLEVQEAQGQQAQLMEHRQQEQAEEVVEDGLVEVQHLVELVVVELVDRIQQVRPEQ